MIKKLKQRSAWISYRIWAESGFFTLLALVIPLALNPKDPFSYGAEFVWPMLGPVLVALRYGFTKGLASVLVLLFLQSVLIRTGMVPPDIHLPFQTIAGYALLVMLCGEFCDWREKSSEKQKRELAYVNDRLETFTRHYHLLRLSHDKLEQMLAGHSLSLRESLQAVKMQIGQLPDRDIERVAQPIMSLFVEYGSLQCATLCKVEEGRHLASVLASVGPVRQVDSDDMMVQKMFETGQLVSLKHLSGEAMEQSLYQVVIPLMDVRERIYAVVLVEQIQFFALNKETLTLLAVTAGYIADLLRNAIANPIMNGDERESFSLQAERANYDAKRYKIPAQLVSWRMDAALHQPVLDYLHATRRGLDVYFHDEQNNLLQILMPLADKRDYSGFKERVDAWAKNAQGKNLSELGIHELNHLALPVSAKQFAKQLEKVIHAE